jgi:hypothetical protein
VRWNEATYEWEYWLGDRKRFVFSDFGLQMITRQFHHHERTNRVEVVVGTHSGQLVLRSIPIKKLREVIKEELGVDIGG